MKKTLLFSAAFFATIAASAQTIVWPSTVNRETKEANLSATVTGSETITATDITLGADIKIGDKDGANAVTAVKNTTGENLQFPSETEGMISWRPINGNVDDAEATADLAEGAGAYIDFTIEEGDIITAIDGTDITTVEDLTAALANYKAGDSAELTISRAVSYTDIFSEDDSVEEYRSGTTTVTFGSAAPQRTNLNEQ